MIKGDAELDKILETTNFEFELANSPLTQLDMSQELMGIVSTGQELLGIVSTHTNDIACTTGLAP